LFCLSAVMILSHPEFYYVAFFTRMYSSSNVQKNRVFQLYSNSNIRILWAFVPIRIFKNRAHKCLPFQGSGGGFCYPQRDRGFERKRTGCECFKDVPPLLKRRKRSYNHIIDMRPLS
uniref:Secreted protein n=1 Tax=Heligmosomoides polygyrus TaxID=6339 RepID=A0A183FJ15_HELPZ